MLLLLYVLYGIIVLSCYRMPPPCVAVGRLGSARLGGDVLRFCVRSSIRYFLAIARNGDF